VAFALGEKQKAILFSDPQMGPQMDLQMDPYLYVTVSQLHWNVDTAPCLECRDIYRHRGQHWRLGACIQQSNNSQQNQFAALATLVTARAITSRAT